MAASALQFTRGEMNSTRNTRVTTYFDAFDAQEVPLLSEIDRRVAEWTGLPIVDHTGMQAKYQVGQPKDDSNTGGEQVHLDNNNNPFRYATAILYLSDVPEAARGATVFPCLLPPLQEGATMSQHAAHRRESAKRAKLCKKATKDVQSTRGWALSQIKEDDSHGLWAMSASICNGTLDGLSVQPKSGRAVMFKTGQFKLLPDGSLRPGAVDPMLWHAACELLEGATKRIIIKFQEVDPDTRAMLMQSDAGVMVPEQMRAAFSEFDLDGDDRLAYAELADLLHSLSGGRAPSDVMRSCDRDGDGHVSLAEYAVNRMWFWPRAPVDSEKSVDREL